MCFGLLLLKIYLAVEPGLSETAPFWLFYRCIPYLPVPLLYFGYCRAVTFEYKFSWRKLLVITPSILVFLFDVIDTVHPFTDNEVIVNAIVAGAFVQATFFLIIMGNKLSILLKVEKYFFIIRITMLYLVLAGVAYLLVSSGWIFDKEYLLQTGGVIVTVLLVGNYLMDLRSGEFRHLLVLEANRELNKYTLLKDIDVDKKIKKLESYMEESCPYLDEKLSLADLSLHIGLSKHQVSQLINDCYQMNFNSFINSYRIKEAKKLLRDTAGHTILSITYAVGFNSKTSFYSSFSKFVGCTPQEYRCSLRNATSDSQNL